MASGHKWEEEEEVGGEEEEEENKDKDYGLVLLINDERKTRGKTRLMILDGILMVHQALFTT